MSEQTPAASSPAEAEDVFAGQPVSFDEFSRYRQSGELPERFKPVEAAESTPADAPEETVEEPETAPESDPEEAQEPPPKGSGAERRIKQLLAVTKELQRKLDAAAKPDVTPASSPVAAPDPQYTRPKPTVEDKKADGSASYQTYEAFVEDLADWKAEQRMAAAQRDQAQQNAMKALQTKLDEARTRYEDADAVIFPAAQAIHDARIPPIIKQVFEESEVMPDLCYVVGSDPDELKKFVTLAQTNPRAALAKVFEYERAIREELAPEPEPGKAPEVKKTTAPKPPSPVGGGSSRAFDVSDESLSPEEWARKRTSDLKKRGKG